MRSQIPSTRRRPRRASPLAGALIRLLLRARTLSRRRSIVLALSCFLGATVIDASVGQFLNPFLPYLVTIFLVGWCLGEGAGLGCALGAAFLMAWMHGGSFGQLHPQAAASPGVAAWNLIARSMVMALFAIAASALRIVVEQEAWRARTDGLTGALNRAAFLHDMAEILPRVRASAGAVLLAYIDLDGFKGVNDAHGHAAGDRVLTAFAEGASGAMRGHDLFARIGGDEFVTLMPVKSCGDGERVAAMLHQRLTAALAATGFPVTCSMGALVCDAGAIERDDPLIDQADRLMYDVKRAGKNAFRIAHAGGPGSALRSAYPAADAEPFAGLVSLIDDRARGAGRRAA